MKKLLSLLLCLAMIATLCVTAIGETAADEDATTVCLCIAESLGDKGFYDSAEAGLRKLEADYGVKGKVAIVNAAEENDFVVAVGWQFWDCLMEVVPQMPDTKFVFVDNGLDGVGDNLLSITYAENEGSFLTGYIAMKLSKTAKIGFVGGEDSDTINNFLVGYRQGALYANPDGTVLDRRGRQDGSGRV